jgi:hypothetical protein
LLGKYKNIGLGISLLIKLHPSLKINFNEKFKKYLRDSKFEKRYLNIKRINHKL